MSTNALLKTGETSHANVLDNLEGGAHQHGGLDPLVARLMEIRLWLNDDLSAIEKHARLLLLDAAPFGAAHPSGDSLARQAARHLLSAPGKWIRPICLLMSSRIGGRTFDPAVRDLAIACELVHSATLLHDDVLDEGTNRRGKATSRIVYGNSASVLGGDHVLLHALKMTHAIAEPHVFTALLETIDTMVNAEAHQLSHKGTFNPAREIYQTVILGKTAVLFEWALLAGASLAGLPRGQQDQLARAGSELGMAFQMIDDILDLAGSAEKTGKTLFADLQEGKMTWPLILAAERSDEALPLFRKVANGQVSAEGLPRFLSDLGVIEQTREDAKTHRDNALIALEGLPENQATTALRGIIQSSIERSL